MTKKVLVVEDNELNLKLFCDLLRAHQFAVEPVRDGREAVAKAREFVPDLIIMDIQMPHVTGYEIILELKADDDLRAIPVMAVTAYARREDEERIRAAGADSYVSKPISLARFMDAVGALILPAEPSNFPFVLSSDRVAASAAYRGRVSKQGFRAPTCPSIRPLDTPLRDYSMATQDERKGAAERIGSGNRRAGLGYRPRSIQRRTGFNGAIQIRPVNR